MVFVQVDPHVPNFAGNTAGTSLKLGAKDEPGADAACPFDERDI